MEVVVGLLVALIVTVIVGAGKDRKDPGYPYPGYIGLTVMLIVPLALVSEHDPSQDTNMYLAAAGYMAFWLYLLQERLKLNQPSSAPRRRPNAPRDSIPGEVRQIVWERDGGRCAACGSDIDLEFDHIVPVAKGGSNSEKNVQLLCRSCNRSKGAKIQ